jgi:hypothetical protein
MHAAIPLPMKTPRQMSIMTSGSIIRAALGARPWPRNLQVLVSLCSYFFLPSSKPIRICFHITSSVLYLPGHDTLCMIPRIKLRGTCSKTASQSSLRPYSTPFTTWLVLFLGVSFPLPHQSVDNSIPHSIIYSFRLSKL